jgi:hypothetical protein
MLTFMCSLLIAIQYCVNYSLMVHASQPSKLPGVKITSHVQNQLLPTGTLSIMGVSTDNSTTDCDVYIILNESKPYQMVNPIGNNNMSKDYSTWNYTFTPEYATIQEGSNRMVSKITCIDHFSLSNENLTKFNSLNVTGVGFTSNATDLAPEISSTELSPNTTHSDLAQLQDPDSDIPNLDNTIAKYLQNTIILNDSQDEEDNLTISNESDDKKDSDRKGSDYTSSSSGNEDEEKEDDQDFIEKLYDRLYDRVLDQVREQLRESGIHLSE